jgi:2,4-dienoyl-CoA reductase-like NADH-dependent reductase (Old Yellow Enzyme family)
MPRLFDPLTLRAVTLRNRVGISPMCMYACENGLANDWHMVHLGSRAVGGAGLVMVEAAGVEPRGRISPADMGIWSEAHAEALAPIVAFIARHGAAPAIQIAHAGRKGSATVPWEGDRTIAEADGGWATVAPTAAPFDAPGGGLVHIPRAMDENDIRAAQAAFREAARLSDEAGFTVLEIHAAHGYLLHEFLTPLVNMRNGRYGGGFEGRTRMVIETARAVREVWPDGKPLFVRISAVDWRPNGWTIEDSIALARRLKAEGVDLIDASSGWAVPGETPPTAPHWQVPFAAAIRRATGIPTAAVGAISDPKAAESIIAEGQADLALIATASLDDPYWPFHAARALGDLGRLRMPPSYDYVLRAGAS